ncbi:hypothetical protein LIER_40145 [Lithospermum erythrorhizon]|uniref:UspA domain-containing protein n=1 Tax=Lithospermum erythrorhizon TaxID=34254 RepID=A0AAV3QQA6_LITER
MVRVRMGGFSRSRAVARVRRVPSPSHHYRKTNSLIRPHENTEFSSKEGEIGFSYNRNNGNRVMVVVDSSVEAKGALQWALSHTVQAEDTIVLLHVIKPMKSGICPLPLVI